MRPCSSRWGGSLALLLLAAGCDDRGHRAVAANTQRAGGLSTPADPAAPVSSLMKTASAQKGRSIYLQNCAVCHGPTGQGNGPLASGLAKKPADLAESKMSDQQLFKVTQDGGPAVGLSSEMKPFGDRLSDAQIADVVAYVKTLRR